MPDSEPDPIAVRASWQTLPLPEARVDLGFAASYSNEDFARIRRGIIPHEMEDKWFIFFGEPWLYLHRSWTGACIYAVRFQGTDDGGGVTAVESWVSHDTKHYSETATDYDRALATFLIERMLLGRPVPFPVPGDLPSSAPAGIYQHTVVGRAYPETKVDPPGGGTDAT
jgi:hypothetical protein